MHGGEASDVAARFKEQPKPDQEALILFLKTLRAPRPTEDVAAR